MKTWIDFKKLREELNFSDVFEKYRVRLQIRKQGKQAIGPCPLPNHSGNRNKQSFSANLEKGIFQCFSCGAKGNVLDFACIMEGHDPENGKELRGVALGLVEHFNISFAPPAAGGQKEEKLKPSKPESRVVVNAPLDFELKDLDPDHEYLRGRKLTPATIRHFGLGYCSRGYFKNRVVIPIHTEKNVLVGYAGRVVDDALISKENPKYLLPGTHVHNGVTHEFSKSLLLYNAQRIKSPVDDLIVVEGFASVWWFTQNGFPLCTALMGSSMSDEQADMIVSLVKKNGTVILIPDGDAAGGRLKEEAETLLADRVHYRSIGLPKDAQPTDMAASDLKRVLSDGKHKNDARHDPGYLIYEFISKFPCLRNLGFKSETWDAEEFDRRSLKLSSGEISVAQFVLAVWNPKTQWQCGRFDLIEAATRLDAEHRQVIIEWFSKPWWP